MTDHRNTLERELERLSPPRIPFDRLERRRDRKRRNQRITAGVVGVAVFVTAVWFVTTGGPFDRGQTPAAGGGGATGPTVTEPTIPPGAIGAGLIGLPPEGAVPSTPASGELVLSVFFTHGISDAERFHAFLYADGRLIWTRLTSPPTGLIEQRLTPEGVELLRSEVMSTGLFDHDLNLAGGHGLHGGEIEVRDGDRLVRVAWGGCCDLAASREAREVPTPEQASALQSLDVLIEDPASWLPASAWEDPEMRPYVPTRYSVCYDTDPGIGLDRVLASLPRDAEDLLRSWDRTLEQLPAPLGHGKGLDIWCSDVTTEEARALAAILEEAGLEQREFGGQPMYVTHVVGGPEVTIAFGPKLPDQVA